MRTESIRSSAKVFESKLLDFVSSIDTVGNTMFAHLVQVLVFLPSLVALLAGLSIKLTIFVLNQNKRLRDGPRIGQS